jgi:hypothetical protein
MRRFSTASIVVCLFALVTTSLCAETLRRARWTRVVLTQDLPEDLTSPEGKTEWDLSTLATERAWVRALSTIDGDAGGLEIVDQGLGEERLQVGRRWIGTIGTGQDVRRWLLPEQDDSLYAATLTSAIEVTENDGRSPTRLRIEARRVGMGWLHLPSGPREVVLQRALIFRATNSGRGWTPERLVHRWVDPLAGVVAEAVGPVSADGTERLKLDGVSVVEEIKEGQAGLKTYEFMMDPPIFSRLSYGYDRKGVCTEGANLCVNDEDCTASSSDICTTPVSALTPDSHATIGDLIASASWDFSANNLGLSRFEAAQTISPVNSAETCSWNECGFNIPGVKLGRSDKNSDDPANGGITTTVTEKERRVDGTGQTTDYTIWLRAGVNKEGQAGSLGQGESRICYTEGGRTPVPLWRFSNEDATGWYWTVGDSWSSDSDPATPEPDPFQCENTIFVHTCPNSCGLFCANSIQACNDYSGTQGSTVIGEGPVTLPSGHTFNALLVRNLAEFCVYLGTSCGLTVSTVRTVTYLWEVPWLGTVVRLTSAQDVADYTSFTEVTETDIKYGLFPPRSIATAAVTDTSVEVTWDPGLDSHRIDGFKVYWSTTSGDYNDTNSLVQAAVMGNSAVVPGLTAGTQYFFTVTSMSDYTNPATSAMTTYESLMFPMTAPAVPDPIPMEVSATTSGGTCVLEEVAGLTVNKAAGGNIELCWDPGTDACLVGYQILGAQSPESEVNFTPVVDDTGLTTCQTIAPDHSYYLVVARGSDGSTGPWGHFER